MTCSHCCVAITHKPTLLLCLKKEAVFPKMNRRFLVLNFLLSLCLIFAGTIDGNCTSSWLYKENWDSPNILNDAVVAGYEWGKPVYVCQLSLIQENRWITERLRSLASDYTCECADGELRYFFRYSWRYRSHLGIWVLVAKEGCTGWIPKGQLSEKHAIIGGGHDSNMETTYICRFGGNSSSSDAQTMVGNYYPKTEACIYGKPDPKVVTDDVEILIMSSNCDSNLENLSYLPRTTCIVSKCGRN